MRTALSIVACCALSSAVAASDPDRSLDWVNANAPGVGGSVGRTLSVNLDGDDQQDLIGLRGTDLIYSMSPAHFDHFSELLPGNMLLSEVIDFDTVPGAAPGGVDVILATTDAGLYTMQWDTSSGLFVGTPLSGTKWIDARFIRTGDVDGDGNADAVGVASDGKDILVSLGTGGGWGPTTSFSIVPTILDLCLLDFRQGAAAPESGLEIAVATTSGVRVFMEQGTRISRLHSSDPNDALTCVPRADLPDVLVWITGGGTEQVLVSLVDDPEEGITPEFSIPLPLTNSNYVSVVAADTDDNGSIELLLTEAGLGEFTILQEVSGSEEPPEWNLVGSQTVSFAESTATLNDANVVVADFDGDTGSDIAIVSQDDESTYLWFQDGGEELVGATQDLDQALFSFVEDEDGILSVHVVAPPSSHYRIVTFVQETPGGTCDPTAINAEVVQHVPAEQTTGERYVDVVIPLDDATITVGATYFLLLAPKDANGNPAGRVMTAAFSRTEANVEDPVGPPPLGPNTEIEHWDGATVWETDVAEGLFGITSGGFVRTKKVAVFPPNSTVNTDVTEIDSSHGVAHPDSDRLGELVPNEQ